MKGATKDAYWVREMEYQLHFPRKPFICLKVQNVVFSPVADCGNFLWGAGFLSLVQDMATVFDPQIKRVPYCYLQLEIIVNKALKNLPVQLIMISYDHLVMV